MHAFGADGVEIEAVLAPTSVDGQLLDDLVTRLSTLDCVTQVFWSPSTSD
jgi:putative Mg2+ transporter-C (MgtC) family protein